MRASRSPERPGALVLGASYRALGVVRSLGRRGVPVWVCAADEHRVACASRYVRRRVSWPGGDPARQITFLHALAHEHGLRGWALLPTCDETAALIARHRAELEPRWLVAAPSAAAMEVAYDKRATHALAGALGVEQPNTCFPAGRADVEALDWRFPLILKPTHKAEANRFTAAKAWRVDSRAELLARYDEACGLVEPETLMVQELVPGPPSAQLSYAALCADGNAIATASAVRLRQAPMDFGKASSHVETTPDGDTAEPARRLLAAMRFTGIVEVEFKRDARDGRPKLLDINARAWGWHTLCARAGVDFPWLQWEQLHGRAPAPARVRSGVRWVRMSTDLPVALTEIRAGRMRARDWLASLRPPLATAIHAFDDPVPGAVDVPFLAFLALRRREHAA
jgi:predicted ATP-grasp superfamily ATP-dependent carboligase